MNKNGMKYFIVAKDLDTYFDYAKKMKLNPNNAFYCYSYEQAQKDVVTNITQGIYACIVNITDVEEYIENYYLIENGNIQTCKQWEKRFVTSQKMAEKAIKEGFKGQVIIRNPKAVEEANIVDFVIGDYL